jgi:hypothetical protein
MCVQWTCAGARSRVRASRAGWRARACRCPPTRTTSCAPRAPATSTCRGSVLSPLASPPLALAPFSPTDSSADEQEEDEPVREADEAVHRPEAHEERVAPRRRDLHRGPQDGALSDAVQIVLYAETDL